MVTKMSSKYQNRPCDVIAVGQRNPVLYAESRGHREDRETPVECPFHVVLWKGYVYVVNRIVLIALSNIQGFRIVIIYF